MKSIKLTTLLAAFAAAFISTSYAGTYTWTGAANDGGLWFTAGNWDFDDGSGNITSPATSSPGNNVAHNIVISGSDVEVNYLPGGDLITQEGTTFTISGGATFKQNGGAWPWFHGDLVIDSATMDFMSNQANPDRFRIDAAAKAYIRNGGVLYVKTVLSDDPAVRGFGDFVFSGKGQFYVEGDFKPWENKRYDTRGVINCNVLNPEHEDTVLTFAGTDLILRSTYSNGFTQRGNSYIDIAEDSTSKFTIAAGYFTVNDVYTKTFGSSETTPKFRYKGEILSEEQFEELFIVEKHPEPIGGNDYYTDFYLKPKGYDPLVFADDAVTATVVSDTAATVSATIDNAGSPDYHLVVVWGKSNGGAAVENWDNAIDLGVAEDGQVISQNITLDYCCLYYYGLVATNENGNVWAKALPDEIFALHDEPTAGTNIWKGTSSTDSRVAANWSLGHVPAETEYVYVLDRLHNVKLDWYPDTGSGTIAGWIQPDAFKNNKHQVMFHTTAAAPLTVTGDVELGGGSWTHVGPADEPVEIVNVVVGGNMTVGSNARIVVGTSQNGDEDDGKSRGYTQDHGPGYLRMAGGSYAGEGGHIPSATGFVSYGSILNPISHGSGGHGDNTFYAGGGVVKLSVSGAFAIDGIIRSRGFGYPLNNENVGGSGSGGSINITAASISGSGTIDANGGSNGLYGPGSGGRVKVALTGSGATFDTFTGKIEAVGGSMQNADQPKQYDISPAAGGTVCLQTAGAAPVVKVFNQFRHGDSPADWIVAGAEDAIPSATHLPAMQNGDTAASLKTTKWELSGRGSIRLTADVLVESLELADDDGKQCVYTEGHTLTVRQLFVDGVKLPSGTYTASNTSWVKGDGSVIASGKGLAIVIR